MKRTFNRCGVRWIVRDRGVLYYECAVVLISGCFRGGSIPCFSMDEAPMWDGEGGGVV